MYRTWGFGRGYLGAGIGYPYQGFVGYPYFGFYPGYGYPGYGYGYPCYGYGYCGSGGLL